MTAPASARPSTSAEELTDRLLIRETLERYFWGIDRGDFDALVSVFTPDAEFSADGPTGKVSSTGAEVIAGHICASVAAHEPLRNHSISNLQIRIEGDRAWTDMLAMSRLISAYGNPREIYVRGLQYFDELVRTPDGWRITRREHNARWQYNTSEVPPGIKQHD